MKNTKNMERHAAHAITGFELQKIALHNLKHWGLKHTTKTILWILIDCYNPENGSVVFPSMEYIAETGDMGLTSVKEGIKELINKGLIIKSKRSKVRGNCNKYLLTPKVQEGAKNEFRMFDTKIDIKGRKTTSERSENEPLEQSDSDRFMITNNKEKIKNKSVVKKFPEKKVNSDEQILLDYAKKMGIAEDKRAGYVIGIKQRGGDAKIIEDYKVKRGADRFYENQYRETLERNQEIRNFEGINPKSNQAMQEVLKKLRG